MRIKFGLNPFKYQKAKDENKETPIDKYVLERKKTNPFYLNTKWDDGVQKEIEKCTKITIIYGLKLFIIFYPPQNLK